MCRAEVVNLAGQSKKKAALKIACSVLTFLLLVPSYLPAQVGAADMLGTITDPTGAVVPNAKITVTNRGTSLARTATTNDRGDYVFNLLPNGSYSLKVEAPSFKTYSVTGIALSTGDRARLDAKLEIGATAEKVEVTAAAAALQTDDSTVGSTLEEKGVQDLPLNGRNLIDAIQVQPGVMAGYSGTSTGNLRQGELASSGNSPEDRRPSSTIVVNGQSDALNDQLIDGFDNNERFNGLIALRPSLDGIEEMKVDTNAYRAEYGRTAGAVVNIVTKAGANSFHGSTFEYFRNDITDAKNYFSPTKPEYRMNEFGGSVGGPIIKNKTFFFADAEDDRIIQGLPYLSTVPTALERATPGDFTDQFPTVHAGPPNCGAPDGPPLDQPPCNQPLIVPPFMLNKISLAYFNLYPMPNVKGVIFSNNYSSSPNKTQFGATVDGRIDHRFSPNDLFFARYAYNPVSTVIPESFPQDAATGIYPGGKNSTFPGPSNTTAQNLQLDYVHIFNSQLLLDLKAAYTRVHIESDPLNYKTGAAAKMGFPANSAYVASDPNTDVLPVMAIFSWEILGSSDAVPLIDKNNSFQYAGSLTYSRGAHNVKFGLGLIRRQVNIDSDGIGGGTFVFVATIPPFFNPEANYLAGYPTVENRQNQPSLYLQDDCRVLPNLTLNLGVRYDVFTPFTEAQGRYVNFDPTTLSAGNIGSQNFILGTKDPTIGVTTDYKDIAPRVGFAYSITSKTVLRGGFGLSFFPADIGSTTFLGAQPPISLVLNQNPPNFFTYFQSIQVPADGPPIWPDLSAGPVAPSALDLNSYASNPQATSLSYKAKNLRSSYVEQMNLFLEREFGANTVSLGYVGVLGQRILRTNNPDLPDPPGAGNPTPYYIYDTPSQPLLPYVTTITHNYNGSSSNYHAMQAIFNRRLSAGLSLHANYTWSHGMSNGLFNTLTNNPSVDYGNTYFDIRNRISLTANYEIPIGKNATGITGVLMKGWQANTVFHWQTGLPFTVVSQALASNQLAYINQPGVTVDRPDVVGTAVFSHPKRNDDGSFQWIDPNAFTPQTQGTMGNERVNQFVGPHDRRDDLSIIKNFSVTERWKVQFRAECFNLSNTPNFANPTTTVDSWTTGSTGQQVPASYPSDPFGSISTLSGGENPRQFQFALKLLF
jgi:hypothetical protein